MRLSELEPEWLRCDSVNSFNILESKTGANGITFICPLCFQNNNMQRPGVHSVICWDPSVPQTVGPRPGRWNLIGTSFEDLSLVAGSSSIALLGGCNAHFFIESGSIRMA